MLRHTRAPLSSLTLSLPLHNLQFSHSCLHKEGMLRYRNSITNARVKLIMHNLRKNATSRSRRIIATYILCICLLIAAIWLAYGGGGSAPLFRLGRPSSDVYYVSKRALCSRSIAHEQLGIQPIAVSKVILRPIVHEKEVEGYDDRLEVLEDALINDTVFLDRNVTGKEAELSTNVCPLHTIRIYPSLKPTRYTASTLVFGVTLSIDEISSSLQHWQYWARKSKMSFHILLPNVEHHRVSEAKEMIRKSLGISVQVEAARDTDDPAKLTLMLVERMHKSSAPDKKWYIILSPTTFVTSVEDILLALEPYNSGQSLYLGGLSESATLREQWGIFAYGGAGIVLSRQLVKNLARHSIFPEIRDL